jgi:hypothetical protein
MDLASFKASLADDTPPTGVGLPLQTLWWEAKGDWKRAHECAQEDTSQAGSAVHAYLHRVEGDLGNAGYWYNRAGRDKRIDALAAEWEALAVEFLAGHVAG